MKITFYNTRATKINSTWVISTGCVYDGPCSPGIQLAAKEIEKYLEVRIGIAGDMFTYYPKDDLEEAQFILKIKTLDGFETNVEE